MWYFVHVSKNIMAKIYYHELLKKANSIRKGVTFKIIWKMNEPI